VPCFAGNRPSAQQGTASSTRSSNYIHVLCLAVPCCALPCCALLPAKQGTARQSTKKIQFNLIKNVSFFLFQQKHIIIFKRIQLKIHFS